MQVHFRVASDAICGLVFSGKGEPRPVSGQVSRVLPPLRCRVRGECTVAVKHSCVLSQLPLE